MTAANSRWDFSTVRRVVVKVGSRLLAESPAGRPAAIADQIVGLRAQGVEVVLVSSGAIALGVRALRLPGRPAELPGLQAAAAVGQSRLMQFWEHAFSVHDLIIGQVLLTNDDLSDRHRFLAARDTLCALLALSAIPIINENDTVSTKEMTFGDNDQLAALVCNLVSADALIILTDVDGVRDVDGSRLSLVAHSDDLDEAIKPPEGDGVGSGGMGSKVASARLATRTGVPCVIAPGRRTNVLGDIIAGQDVGTLFSPGPDGLSSRKHWIAYGSKPVGQVEVDRGAVNALVDGGKSLLSAGVVSIDGGFGSGQTVSIVDSEGNEFARGLVGFDADDLRKIQGMHSDDIEATLGSDGPSAVIHRDDLVIL